MQDTHRTASWMKMVFLVIALLVRWIDHNLRTIEKVPSLNFHSNFLSPAAPSMCIHFDAHFPSLNFRYYQEKVINLLMN